MVILLFVFSISASFINKGFHHVLPSGMLRLAGQYWDDKSYAESIRWFANANVSAFNAGLRWTIADYYIQQMDDFLHKEKLTEASENCSRAVKVLDGHDDEGAVSYNCVVIEQKIKQQP